MRKKPSLITESFEFISSELFSRYSDVIPEIIGKSSGVYALFNNYRLYYIGRAKNLKSRVKQHLKDKHQKRWTHFSLYLIRYDEHIDDVESLLIRIAAPKGNTARPRSVDFKGEKKIRYIIKQRQKEELNNLLPDKRKNKTISKRNKKIKFDSLKGLVTKRTSLYKTYKGKTYVATLTPAGCIIFNNKKYYRPTSAAKAIIKNRTVNGWTFWKFKNNNGGLVSLNQMRQ
ncbi:MAG: GIY-YIG nuclease family protein [Bacteroidota bacterium]